MFKKTLMAVSALAALTLAGAASADTLRIGTEGAYPPWNSTDSTGALVGYEVDLAHAICDTLKMECEIVGQDWDGMIPALVNGKFDGIMAGMSITEERKQTIDFTQGYATEPGLFVGAKDSAFAKAKYPADVKGGVAELKKLLKGKSIGVQTGTIHYNFLEQEFKDVADIKVYDTVEQQNSDLAAGRVDAILADMSSSDPFLDSADGKGFATFGPGLTGVDYPVYGEGVGIGVRKDDTALKAKLNEALCTLKGNGKLSELTTKYFKRDISMPKSADCK